MEHPLDILGVGACPAQPGRRLEGAPAGAVGKVLGVQHDARQHRLGLGPEHVPGLDEVLHQLRHQLAGGAGIGLVVVEGHLLDVAAAPAVVVDDRHPVAALQKLLGLHAGGAVGIHHHQEGVALGVEEGRLPGDEHACILRHIPHAVQKRVGGIVLGVDDDLAGLAPLAGDAADAHGRPQGVHVRVLVAHDIHRPGLVHHVAQGLGHHPGLHLGALLGGLGAAAVELKVALVLHHRLVAAPAQGHLQGHVGVFEKALIVVGIPAHADGERGVDAAVGGDLPDGVENVELLPGKGLIILFGEEEEVAVPVVAQKQAAGELRPVPELFIQGGPQGAALGLGAGLDELLIVIQHQNGHHRAAHVQGLAHLLGVGDIHPVGGGQGAGILLLVAQGAEDPVGAAVPGEKLRPLALSLQEPVGVKAGEHLIHRGLEHLLRPGEEGHKRIVAPEDVPGGDVKHQHGQGRIEHVAAAGAVQPAVDLLHILPHALLGHVVPADAHIDHQHRHYRLDHRQQR